MKTIKTLSLLSASALALTSMNQGAQAAGFYLQEQSISGLGSAFAGQVATPRDSSIVYFNPAGMAKLKGGQIHVGTHVIAPNADMTNTGSTFGGAPVGGGDGGNPYDPTPVPNASISYETIEDTLWLGLSIGAPFGLGSDYGQTWFGRYDSTKTHLETMEITPSFAVKLKDNLSIGGGISYQSADATLENIANQGGGEILAKLEGDDHSFGWNVGVLYEPIDGTILGAHYRSGINHDLVGHVTVPAAKVSANAELDLPDIAQFGINQRINDKWSVQAGATWFGWNSFEEIRITGSPIASLNTTTTQNYQTTWAFAVGGEYKMNDTWTFRAGYQFDETPTTDLYRTSRTPDGDRQWISAGTTYTFNEKLSFDLAATYIDVAEEEINVLRNGNTAAVKADTDGSVAIVAFGLNYKF